MSVDHDVLVRSVDQVVEVELDRSCLGVVVSDTQVLVGERPGDHQSGTCDVNAEVLVEQIVAIDAEQPRTSPGGRGLEHGVGRANAGVATAQIRAKVVKK
jgi:hypothetical protein